LCQKIKSKIGKNASVVFTGGDACLVSKFCKQINKTDSDLTLKGLALIYGNIVH
jgi:pantothenate kinase type III